MSIDKLKSEIRNSAIIVRDSGRTKRISISELIVGDVKDNILEAISLAKNLVTVCERYDRTISSVEKQINENIKQYVQLAQEKVSNLKDDDPSLGGATKQEVLEFTNDIMTSGQEQFAGCFGTIRDTMYTASVLTKLVLDLSEHITLSNN